MNPLIVYASIASSMDVDLMPATSDDDWVALMVDELSDTNGIFADKNGRVMGFWIRDDGFSGTQSRNTSAKALKHLVPCSSLSRD